MTKVLHRKSGMMCTDAHGRHGRNKKTLGGLFGNFPMFGFNHRDVYFKPPNVFCPLQKGQKDKKDRCDRFSSSWSKRRETIC